jgi:hypothetical protein
MAQEMGVGLDRTQIVDADHLDIAMPALDDRSKDKTADAAEPVDRYPNCHIPFRSVGRMTLLLKQNPPPKTRVGGDRGPNS